MEGFCPLASGSRGNTLFIGTKKTKVLIDCGLSAKNIKERLSHINVDVQEINAIVITHEHGDHIQGLKVLAAKYSIPIYANSDTAKVICKSLDEKPKFKIFTTGEPFTIDDMEIKPFRIMHDAVDPVAFTIQLDSLKIGVCTDLGFVTKTVENQLQECDLLYIEANHEPDLVMNSKRPAIYKQRVLGRSGHLSNTSCGELISKVYSEKLRHVYLAHLSEECNTKEQALQVVGTILEQNHINIPLTIAEQDMPSRATLFP